VGQSTVPGQEGETGAASPPDGGRSRVVDLAYPVGWTLAAIGVLHVAWNIELEAVVSPGVRALFSLVVLAALGSIAATWTTRGRAARVNHFVLLGLWALAFAAASYVAARNAGGMTDELALNQRGAELLLQGVNPYGHALIGGYSPLPLIPGDMTPLIGGGRVSELSYPALSFLTIVPARLLGFGFWSGAVTDIVAWIVTVCLMFWLLPRRVRWASLVLGAAPAFLALDSGGTTDFVFVPLLVVAAWRWDRFADPREKSPARWIGPIAMGLAMSVKQTPWLVLPFLLVGLLAESRGSGARPVYTRALRYLVIALATFVVINLPFLALGPASYLRDITQPLSSLVYPDGVGLVSFVVPGHLVSHYGLLRYVSLLVLLVLLAVTFAAYPRVKRALFLFASIGLFFATRSFASYLEILLPPLLVSACTVAVVEQGFAPATRRVARLVALAGAALAALIVLLALALPAPLSLEVQKVRVNRATNHVYSLVVRVANKTGSEQHPYFAVSREDSVPITEGWRPDGPVALAPHATRTVTLTAPSVEAMPDSSESLTVVAFTQSPEAASLSAPAGEAARRFALTLTMSPYAVPTPVPRGRSITVLVRIRHSDGKPYPISNVAVTLKPGPISGGKKAPPVTINSGPAGRQATALTGSQGVARFSVSSVGVEAQDVLLHATIHTGHGWSNPTSELLVPFQ